MRGLAWPPSLMACSVLAEATDDDEEATTSSLE
jgi:hypothetical protein